jgi:polar amino acid transport system substrate-binding protein
MLKFFLIFLFSLFFHVSAAPLKVGMELSYPPFEMICPDGTPCGVSVDMVEAFGKAIGREIQIENIAFTGLVPSLQNNLIDMIVSSLTITEQRKKVIDFSDPYATIGLCLLLNINSPVNTIAQANQAGKTVVVKSGTSGEVYALKNLKKATVRVLDKESACVLEVIQGKADAFIYDQLSVYYNWKKNPDTTRANLTPFQKEQWAFGVRKNNPELLNQINQFIKKFRSEGGFDKLAEKYLPEQKKAFKAMEVPFVF